MSKQNLLTIQSWFISPAVVQIASFKATLRSGFRTLVNKYNMKKLGRELEFISWINRDGSGTKPVTKSHTKLLGGDKFKLYCLSITEKTFIIHGFNSFVVKIKEEK